MQYRNGATHCQPEDSIRVDSARPPGALIGSLQRWSTACKFRRAQSIGSAFLNFVLPPVCVLCGNYLQPSCIRNNLCRPCLTSLPGTGPVCKQCALPLAPGLHDICGICAASPPLWDYVLAPLRYEFPVDRLVQKLKFSHDLAAGVALVAAMMRGPLPKLTDPDSNGLLPVLIPVPLHWSRLLLRGFNQAGELAWQLGRAFDLEVMDRRLIRRRRTRAQSGLDAGLRRENLLHAFVWRGADLNGRHVLLVDDVMTTGSTITACTEILQAAGAGEVGVWVAARSISQPEAPNAHDHAIDH